jgi:hypothetical protein
MVASISISNLADEIDYIPAKKAYLVWVETRKEHYL